ncbi:hypothetical protein DIS24_g7673 [Lasiodiplodia hormozganensis]|uniref:Uncharacterized protein n=1 Tax=Lasiodiplodia hormozganensis TaxID=869390 RepID=A0AA39Y866_9PEZI|nr:hypothetical protein DIS24_g7673 [Lasiodiplodia hormozganensis]
MAMELGDNGEDVLPGKSGRSSLAEEDCIRVLEVSRETINREYIHRVIARALFDTGCPANLVTQQWIRNHDMGHLVKPVSDENDYDIVRHHGVESRVIAEIEMEWYGISEDRKGQIVFLKKNTPRDHFLVVPDTGFDIIIGRETIKRERLTRRRIDFYGDTQGGYSCPIPTPSEKSRQVGREKQRRQKEEQRAQRNQQSRGGTNNDNNGGTGSSPKST